MIIEITNLIRMHPEILKKLENFDTNSHIKDFWKSHTTSSAIVRIELFFFQGILALAQAKEYIKSVVSMEISVCHHNMENMDNLMIIFHMSTCSPNTMIYYFGLVFKVSDSN